MSSQLPSPGSTRLSADSPDEADPELQPEATAPRGLLRAIRQWYHHHPLIADALIALGLVALSILLSLSSLRDTVSLPTMPLTLGVIGFTSVALALRRRFPLRAWAICVIVPEAYAFLIRPIFHLSREQVALITNSIALLTVLAIALTLGTVASHHRAIIAWGAWAATMIVIIADMIATYFQTPDADRVTLEEMGRSTVIWALVMAVGVLVGLNTRSSRLRIKALEIRSARIALAHEQGALLAAAEERSRIAREMHDVVAHSLAVMITMADGAAATVERNPTAAKQAMETLAEAGRSALADTRRLVGVLREDPSVAGGPAVTPADPTGSASPGGRAARTNGGIAQTPSASPTEGGSPVPPDASEGPDSARRSRRPRGRRASASAPSALSAESTPAARGREIRDVPVPEFAPPGTVAPVEPSASIANLRRRATNTGADQSRGDLPLAPAPEQADIAELVKHFNAAGVPVSYRWAGASLPQDKALQLTVFRIAQEALTNVLRYAPTTPSVSVDVDRHIGTVVLTVENEAAPGTRPMHGSGKGLIGMRERASVYGGTVQAGPTPTGWRVRAVLRWDEQDEGTSSWQTPL